MARDRPGVALGDGEDGGAGKLFEGRNALIDLSIGYSAVIDAVTPGAATLSTVRVGVVRALRCPIARGQTQPLAPRAAASGKKETTNNNKERDLLEIRHRGMLPWARLRSQAPGRRFFRDTGPKPRSARSKYRRGARVGGLALASF